MESKRLRTLTEGGRDHYEAQVMDFQAELSAICENLETKFQELTKEKEKEQINTDLLRTIKEELLRDFEIYENISKLFVDLLVKTRTKQSEIEYSDHKLARDDIRKKCDKILSDINQHFSNTNETENAIIEPPKSQKSHSADNSRHSVKSKTASYITVSSQQSMLLKQKAKSEVAQQRLHYAEMEAKLQQERAMIEEEESLATLKLARRKKEVEINMKVLSAKREADEAMAEYKVLYEGISDTESRSSLDLQSIRCKRTQDFVYKHLSVDQEMDQEHGDIYLSADSKYQQPESTITQKGLNIQAESFQPQLQTTVNDHSPIRIENNHPTPMNVSITPPVIDTANSGLNIATEFTKLFLKKELLLSRLTKFTDEPDNYLIWKSSFSSIMSALDVTPCEEVDLLVRWLGMDSSKQAKRIQSANTHDPNKGLRQIWERLDERYGSPEQIEAILKKKIKNFSKITSQDLSRLFELSDIVSEIASVKEKPEYSSLLAYYDSSSGVNPIVSLLPNFLRAKWTDRAFKIKTEQRVIFPPFKDFVQFIKDMSSRLNDPSFMYDNDYVNHRASGQNSASGSRSFRPGIQLRTPVSSKKTDIKHNPSTVSKDQTSADQLGCIVHDGANHSLNQCMLFRTKSLDDRKGLLMRHGVCFRCCKGKHLAKDCTESRYCDVCKSKGHSSALHLENKPTSFKNDGGESGAETTVKTACTQICGDEFSGRSCSKTVLVRVYPCTNKADARKMYAIIDDQSNRSLAKSKFFELFNVNGPEIEYTLSSCSGNQVVSGRRANGFMVEGLHGTSSLELPMLIECNQIPNVRTEIPTTSVALHYQHLAGISTHIPPLDEDVEILLLIGRDLLEAHHVYDQRIGPKNTPYAQKLPLGWVIVGEACLGKVHRPETVNANKTFILQNGRNSICAPCANNLTIKEHFNPTGLFEDNSDIFVRTPNDDKMGQSINDKKFIKIMESGFTQMDSHNWMAPLPFKDSNVVLPNNFEQAYQRAKNLEINLKRNPSKLEHFIKFMNKIFENGHAEQAPPLNPGEPCWYLPIFGVYHPKKPDKIRVVFDSSAKFKGDSLNDKLLTGPDLTNNLVGVLIRFRKEKIAVTADIEQMFFNFYVTENHRDYLRFLWNRDNDPDKDLVEYRMNVHVFGNSPSPAVATYGLRKSVCNRENHEVCDDICDFVFNNFYVDDGLASVPDVDSAVNLMKGARETLKLGGNLRLHKISSNNTSVLSEFPDSEVVTNSSEIDFDSNSSYLQRSLGLIWNIKQDTFTYQVKCEDKPFTRRGMLSTINSVFDPLGFLAPVILDGKIILRNALREKTGWDTPLNSDLLSKWESWKSSLDLLENLQIPRVYSDISLQRSVRRELYVFSDASKEAIGAVAYLKIFDCNGFDQCGFILGKSKLAPAKGHTIPRLELCAAVLAVEIGQFVSEHLHIPIDSIKYYTDSKVVLGYLNNETRRFYLYVSNRVDKIRKFSSPDQWFYVSTKLNPADLATRPVASDQIQNSLWLIGPEKLPLEDSDDQLEFELIEPDLDKNIRPEVSSCKISVNIGLGSRRFEKFSSWTRLVNALALLKTRLAQKDSKNGIERSKIEFIEDSERLILRDVQQELYSPEIKCLKDNSKIPHDSSLLALSPILDNDHLLRVGGRLSRSNLPLNSKNPVIISGKHYISTLLVRHYHEKTHHQGRHITEGAIRSGGYWVTGGKRLISTIIYNCVVCRKLRRTLEHQKMSDLPECRVNSSPPFTYVGVDTFGPWSIVTRRTRGGQSNSKRWAIMFSCLVTRGVHIEVIEELSSSSFINALRRFISLRGPVKEFVSDRGTNFIGASTELEMDIINVEDTGVQKFLNNNRTVWKFNSPHSSHMSGATERMIGITRRILDSLLSTNNQVKGLTHEVLCTFMSEACAIINARPIVAVSMDPESPEVLSPSTLITQKHNDPIESFDHLNIKDLFKSQWKHVQVLADRFWKQWSQEYLQNLQSRKIWKEERDNLKEGDVVLLKDRDLPRNQWPIGVITETYPSADGRIRKVSVRIMKNNDFHVYTRPITELVYLLS